MSKTFKIGQIVPSSNVTMETEIPAMLGLRQLAIPDERFTFHSARMRMKKVVKEELAAMDAESDKCALQLSDAHVDVMGYACLVAIMAMGHGYHRVSEERLAKVAADNDAPAKVVTSAGALVDGLAVLGAKKIVVVSPYMVPLAELVVDYITHEGFEVLKYRTLEVGDNVAVGCLDTAALPGYVKELPYQDADAIVLSACVQMPSLAAVPLVEAMTGKPVITSAIATTYAMLKSLGLKTYVPGAGALLSGNY
jgi:maleate isomerase